MAPMTAHRRRHRRGDRLFVTFGIYVLAILLLLAVYSQSGSPHLKTLVRSSASNDVCDVKDGESRPFTKTKAALSLYIPGVFVLFVGLAVVTDDYFVPSLERICERLDLSEDVAGATFMAAGSSAPELFTSLLATFVTKDDVGVGTIVGSAVFNILVIIGVSAIMAGRILVLDWRPLMRDSVFYAVSISLLLLFTLGTSRGELEWWEGLVLMLGYLSYIAFMKWGNKRYMKFAAKFMNKDRGKKNIDLEMGDGKAEDSPVGSSNVPSSEEYTSSGSSPESSPESSPGSLPESSPGSSPESSPGSSPLPLGESLHTVAADSLQKRRSNYRDFHPRFKIRVASHAIMAANRFARTLDEDSSVNQERQHQQQNQQQLQGSITLPIGDINTPVVDDNGDEEEGGKEIFGIEVPSSIWGKILFPVTFTWSILFKLTVPNCAKDNRAKFWPLTFVLSIVWIGAISYAMVEAARLIGCLIGVPVAIMGLTVLAAGTSVPDALASVAVAKQGQGDMAVSNALGSNVFDILLGLGLPIFLGELIKKEPQAVTVDPIGTVVIPIVILFAVLLVLLTVTASLRWKLRPRMGYILLTAYFLFVLYAVLDAYVLDFGGR